MRATLDGEQHTLSGVDQHIDGSDTADKPKRTGNPLMKGLEAGMLETPYPLDFYNGMMSDEFCFEKTSKLILEPLNLKTEKQAIDFLKRVFKWNSQAEERRIDGIVRDILARAGEDPKVLARLKDSLADD